MSPVRDTPRLFREALDRYARAAVFALIIIPIAPDIANDLISGNSTGALARVGVVVALLALATVLFWVNGKRSARRHRAARARMTRLDTCDTLILPLSRAPEFRYPRASREDAESVPELLIDGRDALNPDTVLLVRSPQVDEAEFTVFVDNIVKNRRGVRLATAVITDVNNPVKVHAEVREALAELGELGSVAVDLTGGTALMSLGLARLAHDLDARCVYVSGDRGTNGRFVVDTQNRHAIDVEDLFG